MSKRVRQSTGKRVAEVPAEVAGACSRLLDRHLQHLHGVADHPNRVLHYDQLFTAHLMGFYDPAIRSLRTLDARSVSDKAMAGRLDHLRLARSTISDAMASLPAGYLLPVVKELLTRLPEGCSHPDAADLMTLKKRIHAIDGSYFRVPADVLWALAHRRSDGKIGRQIRLDTHLDVLRFVPIHMQVDGDRRGSESAAFIESLVPGVIYVADRNFIDFDFLRAVLNVGSDFVARLKAGKSINLNVLEIRELTDADRKAGVLSDQIVTLPGSNRLPGFGDRRFRVVTVYDPVRLEEVRLLTTLLDVPAALVGKIYRYRWVIELFFRWLKCIAKIKHLFAENENGITMQFYTVIIATLLMYLRTGHRPSVYTYVLLASAARGTLAVEKVDEVLERIARERELDRLRRAKKNLA